MKINVKHHLSPFVKLVDEKNNTIPMCVEFNTKTKKAKLLLTTRDKNGKLKLIVSKGKNVIVTVRLPHAKLISRITETEVK